MIVRVQPPQPGFCYKACLEEFLNPNRVHEYLLVHGYPICTNKRHQGQRMGHAWLEFNVEDQIIVFDAAHGSMMIKELYYQLGNIEEETTQRFTVTDSVQMIAKYKHEGPWGPVPKDILFG